MKLFRRLAWWLSRSRHERELAEEMAIHEQMKREELEGRGLRPAAAIPAGRRAMGNATWMREQARGIWIWPWLDRLGQDLRFAFRSARKQPTFAIGVIVITALGVGATTTIFSVVDGVLLRRLPYPTPERLVHFIDGSHSPPRVRDWMREVSSVEQWAASWSDDADLIGDGKPERLHTALVSPDFLTVFGLRIAIGRAFTPADFAGAGHVVLLSDRIWRSRFGGDSAVVGRVLHFGTEAMTVIGVLGGGWTEPDQLMQRPTDIWRPLVFPRNIVDNPQYSIVEVVGRLKPGVTIEAARRELAIVTDRLAKADPRVHVDREGKPRRIEITPLQKAIVGDFDKALLMLMVAVGLMLLIACANLVNLYLARSTDRYRELAVRAALGAGRGRLTGQLVTESVSLGIVGGAIGVVLARVGVRAMAGLYPGDLPRAAGVAVDLRVLAFALGLSIVTGLIFGLVPAWLFREGATHEAIKAGAPAGGRRRNRLRSAMIVGEVALALVLLVGSGLLFHSFLRIIRVDPGFDPAGIAVAQLQLREPFTPERRVAFAEQLVTRLRTIPGVTGVAYGVTAPMSHVGQSRCCWGDGEVSREDGKVLNGRIVLSPVGPGYFETIGGVLRGSGFGEGEKYAAPHPAVISDRLAEGLFGDRDPIGQTITVSRSKFVVRGVISGLHPWGQDQESGTEIYLPYQAFGGEFHRLSMIVRSGLEAGALAPAIRQAVWAVDASVPADDIQTMEALLDRSLAGPRFFSTLMGGFAALALILAAVGIYASMLYTVRQRMRELGIRVALGARAGDIAAMVVGHAGRLAVIGIGLGVVGAIALARALGAFLFGITPADPIAFGAAAVVLTGTVLLAAYLPARRAGEADPLTVLRAD